MTFSLLSSEVDFVSVEQAAEQISTSDEYTQNLTPFDLHAKIQTLEDVSEADYLSNCTSFVRPWANDEVAYLGAIIGELDDRLQTLGVKVVLPTKIVMVKTTGWEEGGANGYTRENAIFLNRNSLGRDLFTHELFHIISRHNPEIRNRVYKILGFELSDPIEYNDDLRITNPDTPTLMHLLTVGYGDSQIQVAMIIRSQRKYAGGGFFSYVVKRLLTADSDSDTGSEYPGFSMLRYDQVRKLYDQIGRNTAYNIHQEELSAVHFRYLVNGTSGLPDQHLVDSLGVVLSTDENAQ